MADNTDNNPDAEARKWFVIAILGALLYVTTVFSFVVTRDVAPSSQPIEAAKHD
jgi:hypothetical protein